MNSATPTISAPVSPITWARRATECAADRTTLVTTEGDHEAERPHDEAGPEGLQVDEPAAHEHQDAHRDEDERNEVGGNPERVVEPVDDGGTDGAAVPAEPEHRREEQSNGDHPQSPELGMMVRSLLRCPLPRGGRRRARLGCPLDGLLPGHGHRACCFCGGLPYPPPDAHRDRDRGRRRPRRARPLRPRRADRPAYRGVPVGHLRGQRQRRVPDRVHGRGARAAVRGLMGARRRRDRLPRRLHDLLDVLARHVPPARGGPHRAGRLQRARHARRRARRRLARARSSGGWSSAGARTTG